MTIFISPVGDRMDDIKNKKRNVISYSRSVCIHVHACTCMYTCRNMYITYVHVTCTVFFLSQNSQVLLKCKHHG